MTTPRLEIDLDKISHNARELRALYGARSIGIAGVTKAVCGDPAVAAVLVDAGIHTLADSRTRNIERMREADIRAQFVLLRSPALSQVQSAVKCADVSLNSELSVIEELSKAAAANHVAHKILLMVELGDLREGLMPAELGQAVELVDRLEGLVLAGIGTNLACFGGVKPDEDNVGQLSALARDIEDRFGITLEFVSGGNSANYEWFMATKDTGKINHLRLGESILLGRETLHRKPIPGLFTDAFNLVAEVIESKVKPSQPYGEICQGAFGEVPVFPDRGQISRAILGVGMQDVLVSGLTPRADIDILGASSDHIIIDANRLDLRVGDEVEFHVNYGALLSAMTSPYVCKRYVDNAGDGSKETNTPRRVAAPRHRRVLPNSVPR